MRLILPLGGLLLAPAALSAQTLQLDEIVVSANRAESLASRTGSSVSVLTGDDLETDGRPFVLRQITDLPGVTVQQNGPPGTVSGFAVRGAPQQYVRVEVDGIEISDPTGTQVSPSLSGFLVDDVSRIEVLKGSQSALYGGQAVGGVISITTPRATEDGISNRLILEGGSYSTFRGGYTLAGQDDRGDFALSIARFQTDGFSAAEEADGNTEADGYTTTRLSGSGDYYLTDTTSLFASAFWQQEDGDYDETVDGRPVDAPSTFDTTNWGLRAGLELTTDAGFANTFALSYFDVDRLLDSEHPLFGASTFETDGGRARAEYVGSFAPTEALSLQYGADYAYETTKTNYTDPFFQQRFDESTWIAGAFAQSTWSIRQNLVLDAAARLDEHSEFGGFPTGRLTLAWLPLSDTTIRGSLGTGFRAPSNYELFDPFSGNPDLDPETSVSADLGIAQRFADGRGEVGATLFWLEIDDLIEFDTGTFTYFQADGTSTSRGLELSALWQFSEQLILSGAYTYTDAEQPNGAPRDRIPRHDLAVTVAGAATDRISYDLGAQFVYDLTDDSATDFAGNVIPSDGFQENYVTVNARIAYALNEQAQLYLRAENLFDEQYQTARGYSTSDQAFYFGVSGQF